jgi:glycosyltransferase involved in cell wall biosynthesis
MKTIVIFTIDSPLNNFGGLGESVRHLCFNLPEYNFVTFGFSEKEHETEKNINHHKITDIINGEDTLIFLQLKKIKEIIEKHDVKLIHVFDWTFVDIAYELSKSLNIKWIYTSALSAYQKTINMYEIWKNIIPKEAEIMLQRNLPELRKAKEKEDFVFENSSSIIFVSEYYRNLYKGNKNCNKFNVIMNGIDFSNYSRTKQLDVKTEIPGLKENLKVLYLGRFDSMKNVTALLETKIPPGIDLILAGDSKAGDLNWLEDFLTTNANALSNVYNVGFLRGAMKKFYLQNVDAVIVPSIHEPFGIVALEAIASKTILISSRAGGMKDFITTEMCIDCGFYTSTIYSAYLRLKSMSIQEKNSMIELAYKNVQHLTWIENAENYGRIYKNLI